MSEHVPSQHVPSQHVLSAAPSLLPIYARAALTGPLHRGGSLPDSRYRLDDQTIDRGHLADYQRVCGFAVSDVLPMTYLHLLAFPLSMALMNESAFPFPLVGLVHVANSITVHRPVTADETVSVRVRADGLRPHAAGTQFDVLAEIDVDDETVWTGTSTYLRRGATPAGTERPHQESPPKERRAQPPQRGAVTRVRVPGDVGRRYAAVSGDRNPIHLHPLAAKLFGFPSAIAHGMWLQARTLATLEGRLPDAGTVDVAFKLPVLLPTTVSIATPRADGPKWELDVRGATSGKPHLTGSVSAAG